MEKLQIHLRRGFEEELAVNSDGTTTHVDIVNHCLLYAFGECNEQHSGHCTECNQLFVVIKNFMSKFEEQKSTIEECRDKLYYFLVRFRTNRFDSNFKVIRFDSIRSSFNSIRFELKKTGFDSIRFEFAFDSI